MKFLLTIILLLTSVSGFAARPTRVLEQTSTVFGTVGDPLSFQFQKSRKTVTSATLTVQTTWQWDYVLIAGPEDIVTIAYSNTQVIAGVEDTAVTSATVTISSRPTSFQHQSTYVVPIAPGLLTGTGSAFIPITTSGSFTLPPLYTSTQIPRVITTGVLQYTTGR